MKMSIKSMKICLQIPTPYDMLFWYELNLLLLKIKAKEEIYMAKVCYFTGRKTKVETTVHAMNSTKRTVKPNLQKVRVLIDGKP